jgi:HAD superfamily hydrolase (TIGR01509 family)
VGEVSQWLQTRMVELFHERLPLRDGALELLEALHGRGVPQALVSASYRALVDAALDVVGRDIFAFTLGGDEVTHAKPHPEAYLTAAAALGAEPSQCVVIEDSLTGVEAAEAAGCVCVALPEHVHIPAGPGRPVLTSFRDIDPDWLLSLPAVVAKA